MTTRWAVIVALCTLCAVPPAAQASSNAAWSAFEDAVAQACVAKAKEILVAPKARVDPHGSPSYGIAIVRGHERGPGGKPLSAASRSVVCVYDKKTGRAELSGVVETSFTNH